MSNQRMPRSCGLTLRTFRYKETVTTTEWTRRLRPHVSRRYQERQEFTSRVVKDAEHSEQALYWVWDAYAKLTGYPTGLIYLFSRISSDLRDKKLDDVKKISKTLRKLADYLDHKGHELSALEGPNMDDKNANEDRHYEKLTAYNTIIGYHKTLLPDDHEEEAGIPYKQSKQRLKDGRQVRILLKLLRHVPPPFEPGKHR